MSQIEAVGQAPAAQSARAHGFWALTLGSVGVVFGDIGTSPLYAVREALAHARGGASDLAVLGVVSLIFWALVLVVTIKYLVVVMRADNQGEGGTLALMALAQHALGRRSLWVVVLGVCGAALFYGDGLITPAISVLSAAEGLAAAPVVGPVLAPYVLPAATCILVALFMVQSRGTATVGRFFGPVTLVWFAVLAAMGIAYILKEPRVLMGLSPYYGVRLLISDGWLGLAILGSVFLVVTGAEALYADIGHFGKGPIRTAWLAVAFPCLMLNYLGQGALVLADPAAQADPFFRMIPAFAYWPVLALTTAATVIASQAVITGAFSMTQQAVQLGLLPRLDIRRTSETVSGQIYVPQVNALLMIGVIFLLYMFRNSSNLAAAYGIAVTATMVITVLLAFVVMRRQWGWSLPLAIAVAAPLLALDLVFFGANTLKIAQGGWFPLLLGASLVLVMWTWRTGSESLAAKSRRESVPLADLIRTLQARPPFRVAGTAVFLTSDPDAAPVALMHNLKHNRVLHEQNIILSVVTSDEPRVAEDQRVTVETLAPDFRRVRIAYGFMESPNVPKALGLARRQGVRFDIMATSFFLGRRSVVPTAGGSMPLWQDRLFVYLMRNAANPTDFFRIPPGRVVELGAQMTV
ncbi:potassium transporter Kup [Phenylobacterium sp.]|uniref:potassium transporter Kup n=1 Tax=Phenylobacterium sp. TaxID=1871053 RepID=UPI0035B3C27F